VPDLAIGLLCAVFTGLYVHVRVSAEMAWRRKQRLAELEDWYAETYEAYLR